MKPAELTKLIYTADEYLKAEQSAEFKSEYFHGEIFAMAGGTPNHNRLTLNMAFIFNSMLKGKCEAFASDIKLQVDEENHYTYPDVMVVCGELEFAKERKDTVINPVVIVEVLSESTKDYDRGTKFTAYRKITTLKDYILVDQDKIHIEYFAKEEDGTWRFREYFHTEDALIVQSVNLQIPVKEIYERVFSEGAK